MELNGGLAFGAAIAGGALFGPMGVFGAACGRAHRRGPDNYRHAYPVFYQSQYADEAERAAATAEAAADAARRASRAGPSRIIPGPEREEGPCSRRSTGRSAGRSSPKPVWRTIARRGLENTSIRNITEDRAGLAAYLQRYFRDKDELMLFAYELASDPPVAVNVDAIGDATGLEALRRRLLIFARPDAGQRQVTAVLTAFTVQARTQPALAQAIHHRYGDWVRVTQASSATWTTRVRSAKGST